jgi:hypothetical protein
VDGRAAQNDPAVYGMSLAAERPTFATGMTNAAVVNRMNLCDLGQAMGKKDYRGTDASRKQVMANAQRTISATIALALAGLISVVLGATAVAEPPVGFADPRHGYWTRPSQDRFRGLKAEIEAGTRQLDLSSEKALLVSLLRGLEIPVSSQMLVYSATSLQKGLINPRNPRALYFNEDTYVGFVPGGRIEIVSLDPDLGGIFYLSDPLRSERLPRIERSDRCMTCHAPHYLHEIPGLIVESVVPGLTGGGETAFRREQSGHGIPFDQRFGGWHVTGAANFPRHWGNMIMEYTANGRQERAVQMGELFDAGRYPVGTSDILPHLVHEHQVGFVNRMVEATYLARAFLQKAESARANGQSSSSPEYAVNFDKLARPLVRYLLFADEVRLPAGGVEGDSIFKTEFLRMRRSAKSGASLKDLDLQNRLFRYRCSYMIYSPAFSGLPAPLKARVYSLLDDALNASSPEFAYMPLAEKREIRAILKETVSDLPPQWRNTTASTVR